LFEKDAHRTFTYLIPKEEEEEFFAMNDGIMIYAYSTIYFKNARGS